MRMSIPADEFYENVAMRLSEEQKKHHKEIAAIVAGLPDE